MVRLLFHVLAHVYHSHFKEIVLLQLHAHLNALFAHFVGFSVRFSLLEDKELEVRMPICWTLDKKSSRSIQRSVIDTFYAEIGWIPYCGRPESSSSNIR